METTQMTQRQRRLKGTTARRNSYLRRFQLLRYRDVTRLCNVMETVVPIHGMGNFPTLEIQPSRLVQLVRNRLENIGIRVRDIRLNGSAATHVLSDDETLTYKDLDLIFAIDFPGSENEHRNVPEKGNSAKSGVAQTTEQKTSDSRSLPVRPTSLPGKNKRHLKVAGEEMNDDLTGLDDSGYTSSGSSITSAPVSPSSSFAPPVLNKSRRRMVRSRTRSLESTSSTISVRGARAPYNEDFATSPSRFLPNHHSWQEIKDATMDILLDFIPEEANCSNMNSIVLGSAYVQKMVKVSNEADKWSLISLNNNSGRNLELKFVQSMKRQFEFSVDSFQIVLDTYLAFRKAAAENDEEIDMKEGFHPTVIAESVYGDFAAALRHLRQRRICTHRPEEIRGGGLLRYCNLLTRNFIPGDCDDLDDADDVSSSNGDAIMTSRSRSDVEKLEQHMCSRFFIDFSDIDSQRKKLFSYLESHFVGEEDLKFQYLLVLRKVVDASTVCLMQHERNMILDLITMLMKQTFANNVAKSSSDSTVMQRRHQQEFCYTAGQRYTDGAVQRYGGFSGQPIGERSSPLSTYSVSSPIPPDNPSTPNSPLSLSRPVTPALAFYGPSQCTNAFPHVHDFYQRNCSSTNIGACCTCCCGCCCCSNHRHSNAYEVSRPYFARESYVPTTIQPIFYNPTQMTCFYQPANYGENPQV